jgi:hypothetical protein
MNNFNEFCDIYYDVNITSKELDSLRWLARATVVRKDTKESIARVQAWSDTNEDVVRQLEKKLKPVIESLPRPPSEWNNLRIRQILIAYRKFNDEITSIYVELERKRKSGYLSENDLKQGLDAIYETVKSRTIDLIGKIGALSETEKQQLVISSENAYPKFFSSTNFDEICIREAIFDYILSPSIELINLHRKHQFYMYSELESSLTNSDK